jgi:hypothetical protein
MIGKYERKPLTKAGTLVGGKDEKDSHAPIINDGGRKVKRNDLFLPQPHQAAYPVG